MALPRWAAGFLHPKQAELPRGWHSPAALLGPGTRLGAVPRGSRDHRLLASTVLKGLMQPETEEEAAKMLAGPSLPCRKALQLSISPCYSL